MCWGVLPERKFIKWGYTLMQVVSTRDILSTPWTDWFTGTHPSPGVTRHATTLNLFVKHIVVQR